ncbi:MAG: histidine kinase [Bacteroidota bacterium]
MLIILNLSFWLALTVIAATLYFISFGENYDGGWWNFFWRQLPIWMFWGIVFIPIFYAIRFFKNKRYTVWKQILFHFGMLGVLFFCFFVLFIAYSLFLSGDEVSWNAIFQSNAKQFILNYILNLLVYLLVITFIYGWYWYAELQESKVERSMIQARLHEARLDMLTSQLHPHFLFNALNSISGLMRKEDNEAAIKAIADLGQLLRLSLDYQSNQFIPLQTELDFIEQYLKLEQLRFGDNLKIRIEVADDLQSIMIPALILQPLVENAIKHGMYKSKEERSLEIQIKKEGLFVLISIVNDCSEAPIIPTVEAQKGLGIENVNQRLSTIYSGRDYQFDVKTFDKNKVLAFLKLPI